MDLHELKASAEEFLQRHGLVGWTFTLARTKRRLGACKHRLKRIEIGEYYAFHNPPTAVLDTLLHEIAHAIAGPEAGHGPEWKSVAIRIGAQPQACDTSPDTVVQPGDWQSTCPACERTHHRYRRPMAQGRYRCKCPAGSSLFFEYAGDPARAPVVSHATQLSAQWEAICAGCGAVHRRVRRPKAGLWRCGCMHKCEIKWEWRRDTSDGV